MEFLLIQTVLNKLLEGQSESEALSQGQKCILLLSLMMFVRLLLVTWCIHLCVALVRNKKSITIMAMLDLIRTAIYIAVAFILPLPPHILAIYRLSVFK